MRRYFGKVLKNIVPDVYQYLVNLKWSFKYHLRSRYPYITHNLGGNFKEYLKNPDYPFKYEVLISELDETSIATIDTMIYRFEICPDKNRMQNKWIFQDWLARKPPLGGLLAIEKNNRLKKAKRKRSLRTSQYYESEDSVDYFLHGLKLLPSRVVDRLANTIFIDVGSYNGDSAIALEKVGYSKIISFDISLKSIGEYYKHMALAKIDKNKYEMHHLELSDGNDPGSFTIFDTGAAGMSSLRIAGHNNPIEVKSTCLDKFCADNDMKPSFIKADIEGTAKKFIEGSIEVIKMNRPVLSIAIYHNPYEFFEIKPLLQASVEDYIYLVRKLSSKVERNLCHSEVYLLAYPKEWLDA